MNLNRQYLALMNQYLGLMNVFIEDDENIQQISHLLRNRHEFSRQFIRYLIRMYQRIQAGRCVYV